MALMKKDMGGAAAVLALASMIMEAGLPVRLRVLIAAAASPEQGNAIGVILLQGDLGISGIVAAPLLESDHRGVTGVSEEDGLEGSLRIPDILMSHRYDSGDTGNSSNRRARNRDTLLYILSITGFNLYKAIKTLEYKDVTLIASLIIFFIKSSFVFSAKTNSLKSGRSVFFLILV